MLRYILLLFCLTIPLSAQFNDTVNGVPIPENVLHPSMSLLNQQFILRHEHPPATAADQQEVSTTILHEWQCSHLHNLIRRAAVAMVKAQLNLPPVTDAEAAEAKAEQDAKQQAAEAAKAKWLAAHPAIVEPPPPPPNQALDSILTGLTQVCDQGQDPSAVYQQLNLAQQNIPRNVWLAMAQPNDPVCKKTEAKYKGIQAALAKQPDLIDKAQANPSAWKSVVEGNRFAAAVDQMIAAQDPAFRQLLPENHWTPPPGMNMAQSSAAFQASRKYLKQSRETFWQAQDAKVEVYLTDPTIGKSCGLPQFQ